MAGRLAMEKPSQGFGWGRVLLADAVRFSGETANRVGSCGVTVEAIDDNAREFYKRFGFSLLKGSESRLFLEFK